jgi:hypothetical protein
MKVRKVVRALPFLMTLTAGCLPDFGDHSACAPPEDPTPESSELVSFSPELFGFLAPERLEVERRGERLFVEHDMALTPSSIVTTGKLWDPREIPYRIHPDLPSAERVREATHAWEKATEGLLHFREIAPGEVPPPDFLEFIAADGCWSYVGRVGGRQEISLARECGRRASVHEIGHALGLWHEQSRADRDEYVSIRWCNIEDGKAHNFRKRKQGASDVGPYDYASIMHYPSGAFSKNRRNTIQSITATPVFPWSNGRISEGDRRAIGQLYGPRDRARR